MFSPAWQRVGLDYQSPKNGLMLCHASKFVKLKHQPHIIYHMLDNVLFKNSKLIIITFFLPNSLFKEWFRFNTPLYTPNCGLKTCQAIGMSEG